MELDRLTCHRALLARDERFDGLFFTCVSSTGVYCRPICPARPPKIGNCLFVTSAAAAQEAGFRACLRCRPDVSPAGAWDGFELGVRAIVGQQIAVTAASKLAGKLAARYGEPAFHVGSGLSRIFPGPLQLSTLEVDEAGMPRHRAATIRAFAKAVLDEPELVTGELDLRQTKARLQEIPGIGAWTASYFAMRALQDCDAFLAGDAALRRILAAAGFAPTAAAFERLTHDWRPWRAYGVLHLWTAEMEGDLDALAA